MNKSRVCSFPDLSSTMTDSPADDTSLEGITANIKLLLKLLKDHNDASQRGADPRQAQRFAGMVSILDDVKARIQKSQTSGKKKQPELRRCNTDLRGSSGVDGKASADRPPLDEKEKLRRELNTSFAAQKRLGVMCSSLGKEKQIIARELSRKVQELNGMEEVLHDYKAQNERLAEKIRACRIKHLEEAKKEVEIGRGMVLGLKKRVAKCEGVESEFEELEQVLQGIGNKLTKS